MAMKRSPSRFAIALIVVVALLQILMLDFLKNAKASNPINIDSERRAVPTKQANLNTLAKWSPNGEWIAFVSNSSGNLDIWIARPDGSVLHNLTSDSEAVENLPVWSPDGERIAFISTRGCDRSLCWSNVWVMEVDGSNLVNVTAPLGGDLSDFFSWSPDGKHLAVTRYPASEQITTESIRGEIWIVDTEGKDTPRKISPNDGTAYSQPSWSPDGNRVAFIGRRPSSIGIASFDGTEFTLLDPEPYDIWSVYWSPVDENLIVATREQDSKFELVLIEVDTESVIPIELPLEGRNPVWSPDGNKILFWLGNLTLGFDVATIEVNSKRMINLTEKYESWDLGLDWSPDGSQVVFVSNRDGVDDIWVMDENGSNPINLTGNHER